MLPGADATDNPVASDKPTPSETKEDTTAVVSPAHTDFLLTRLGGAYVALPITVPYVAVLGAAFLVALNTHHEGEVSALIRVVDICTALSALFTSTTAVSLRRVLGTGDGRVQVEATLF